MIIRAIGPDQLWCAQASNRVPDQPCTQPRPRTPDTTQFVIFAIGDDQYGIAIMAMPRVVQSAHIDFLLGLVTVDGAMIALIKLPISLPPSVQPQRNRATSSCLVSRRNHWLCVPHPSVNIGLSPCLH